MEAIREIQTVEDGQIQIHLPMQFWGRQVEIIILSAPQQEQGDFIRKKSLRGCLRQYANPALMAREHEAWQDAMNEKHGHR